MIVHFNQRLLFESLVKNVNHLAEILLSIQIYEQIEDQRPIVDQKWILLLTIIVQAVIKMCR